MQSTACFRTFTLGAIGAVLLGPAAFAGDPGGTLAEAPGEASMVAYFQTPHQIKLSAQGAPTAKSPGDAYDLLIEVAPSAQPTGFREQTPAYSTVVTTSLQKNGLAVSSTSATVYYRLRPFGLLGKSVGKGSPYGVVKGFHPLPATLTVGSSGPFNHMGFYHDADMAAVDAYQTGSYSVSPNDASSLLLCLRTELSNVTSKGVEDGLAAQAETDCYRIGAGGNASLVSVELPVGGETLVFR